MDSTIKALHKNIAEWMAGPTGAVVMHVLMILALLFLVDFSTPKEEEAIDVKYVEAVAAPFDPPPPPLQPPADYEDEVPAVTPPDVTLATEITPPETPDFTQPSLAAEMPDLTIENIVSPVVISGLTGHDMAIRKAVAAIHKPFEPDAVLAAVKKACGE